MSTKQSLFLTFLLLISTLTYGQDTIWENVFVPNMFSPNNDTKNDEFKVYGKGLETLELKIYDRWAELVYYSEDVDEILNIGWDGKTNGKNQPIGTYLWVLSGTFSSGKEVTIEGKNSGSLILTR